MTEGRPIVVGVDGSSGSEAAVGWAAREASLRGLPLRVVHATLPRHLPAMRSMAVETTTNGMDHAREIATAGAMAARRSDPTLSVDVQVYLNETPAQALAREAGSAALLVLGLGCIDAAPPGSAGDGRCGHRRVCGAS
jgi:nucleotide-binding universal stress UspA family protein